jgi:hypothetical protein
LEKQGTKVISVSYEGFYMSRRGATKMRSKDRGVQLRRLASCASKSYAQESRRLGKLTYNEWALLRIIRHRFVAFKKQFGRRPGNHEPLFFFCGVSFPIQAEPAEVERQIREAARAEGVDAKKVLSYLGF